MKKGLFTIGENRPLTDDVYQMTLLGDTQAITTAGQFVNIALDGFYLRRPISVCDWAEGELTLLYKVVGKGTAHMASLEPGAQLDLLTGLGNGYDLSLSGEAPLLIGGGVGVPPLYGLAKRLRAQGKMVSVILGFKTVDDVFYLEEFRALGAQVVVTTEDGSFGKKGFVTDGFVREQTDQSSFTHIYTCGPEGMLKAVYEATDCDGQFSFEERMGCGFGGCMGCSCETKYGSKRICREGPVLRREEIIW